VVQTRALAKRRRIKPLRKGGKEYYVLVVSNEQCRDLKLDPDYKAVVANADKRGSDNPLFQNAMVTIDGVVIYEHEKVANTLGLASAAKWGAGGLVDGAQALMMGAQALGFASTTSTSFDQSDNTDYKNKVGVAVGRMFGLRKPRWVRPEEASTQDYSIVSLYTAASPVQ
jgi:N4-gp56 family major capsid protein